jgi:DNA-binding transcriptional MerR regulator
LIVARENYLRAGSSEPACRASQGMSEKPLLIGRLANLAGVKLDTVRFYERSGLLPKPSRTSSGYRIYDGAALNQVRFIRKAQSLGFSLDEIRRIMGLRGQGSETCRCVIAMAEATLAETETKLEELRKFKDTLATNLARWKRKRRGPIAAEFCALIEGAGQN